MRVVIAGSSGLIGTALVAALRAEGHRVARLVRRKTNAPDEFRWDPPRGDIDPRALSGADAVINLCGVGATHRRWTGAFKQELRDSRIIPTDVLAGAVADAGVEVLINAGGVHYYGPTGDRIVTESSQAGSGFLASLCRDWEAACRPASERGVRTVVLRSGLVLSSAGGLLPAVRRVYLLGLGGPLGNGRQYVPWISLTDEIGAICFVLLHESVKGPLNVVGPAPVTNAAFSRALGLALRRPSRVATPAFALRVIAGEFADEALLTGPRAIPAALERAGFSFAHPAIGSALAAAIG